MKIFYAIFTLLFAAGSASISLAAETTDAPNATPSAMLKIEKREGVRECIVPILTVDSKDGKGVCTPVKLRWMPDAPESQALPMRVSISEEISGTGQFLRTSAWVSLTVASLALNEPLCGAKFEIETPARIDGASAGGVFALGLMCLLAGEPFPSDLGMTGAINPDGSIGPVSGIVQKMAAAKVFGLKRVIVPAGQRFDRDASTRQEISLVKHAQSLGLEIMFAKDLQEACALATGRKAMEDASATVSEPTYSQVIFDELSRICTDEIAIFEKQKERYQELVKREKKLRPAAQALLKKIRSNHGAGRDAYQAGKVYVASELLKDANAAFDALQQLPETGSISSEQSQGWIEQSQKIRKKLDAALFEIPAGGESVGRGLVFSERAALFSEMTGKIDRSQSMLQASLKRIAQTPPGDKKMIEMLQKEQDYFSILLFYANHHAEYQLYREHLYSGLWGALRQTEVGVGVASKADKWTPILLQACLANADYFGEGVKLASLRMKQDLLYDPQFAVFSDVAQKASDQWAFLRFEGRPVAPMSPSADESLISFSASIRKLGGLMQSFFWMNAYCESALLQQKYLALGGGRDENFEWQTSHRTAMIQMLETADKNARHGVALLQEARQDTSLLALIYERATWFRDSNDDADKLTALRDYWRVALFGRLAWNLTQAK